MKSLVLQNKKVWVEDAPVPVVSDGYVVVKVMSTPICGSDKGAYFSNTPARWAGHEGTGVVVDAGKSSILRIRDRVVLNPLGGCGTCVYCLTGRYIFCGNMPECATHFAQYLRVHDFVCPVLPDDISYDTGAMACCALGPAFSAIRRMQLTALNTLLITGLGPVGMGAVAIAKFLGARIIAVDAVPFRKKMAEDFGADVVLDAADPDLLAKVRDAARPGRLLHALDASGNSYAERLCINAMEPGGMVAFAGENHSELAVGPSHDFIRKGLTVFGVWHYDLSLWEEMKVLLRRSPLVPRLVTHTFGFSQAQEAFDQFMGGDACKVVLHPWE